MFTLGEWEEDPTSLLDFEKDAREEWVIPVGDVSNVVLYGVRWSLLSSLSHPGFPLTASFVCSFTQQEPEGVITVKFRDPTCAKACVIVSRPSFSRFHISLASTISRNAR